jgi:hypothetical protein
MLSGVVEYDVGGPMDFKPAEFMQGNGISPKTLGCAIGVE